MLTPILTRSAFFAPPVRQTYGSRINSQLDRMRARRYPVVHSSFQSAVRLRPGPYNAFEMVTHHARHRANDLQPEFFSATKATVYVPLKLSTLFRVLASSRCDADLPEIGPSINHAKIKNDNMGSGMKIRFKK